MLPGIFILCWKGGQLIIDSSKLPFARRLYPTLRRLETDKDGLRRERDAEFFRHPPLNLLHQPDHFTRGRAAAIDDRQRMLRRDSHPPSAVAFMKASALDQPGGGDFHSTVAGREIRNLFGAADQISLPCDPFDASERVRCDD